MASPLLQGWSGILRGPGAEASSVLRSHQTCFPEATLKEPQRPPALGVWLLPLKWEWAEKEEFSRKFLVAASI